MNTFYIFLLRTGGENFTVLSGPCTSTAGCVASSNFPNNYGNSELCEIVAPDQSLYFMRFETEIDQDFLTIDGQAYSGSSGPPQGTTSSGIILWSTSADTTASGWQMCTLNGLNKLKLGTERERESICVGTSGASIVLPHHHQNSAVQVEFAKRLVPQKSTATQPVCDHF